MAAYDTLSDVRLQASPLDESTVALVKLAVSIGCGTGQTVHFHSTKARRAGVDPEALGQVAFVALPTIDCRPRSMRCGGSTRASAQCQTGAH